MDKNTVKGAIKKTEGRIEKAAGDVTGNDEMKAKGQIKEGMGKVQEAAGRTKDAIKKADK